MNIKEKQKIVNKYLKEFPELLKNFSDAATRAKIEEILKICLEEKFYLKYKKALEIIFLWFEHSIQKIILLPYARFFSKDETQAIFQYFYQLLQPEYKSFDKNKGTPTVFLTQLLKTALNAYLRDYYKKKKKELLYDFDINEEYLFADSIPYTLSKDVAAAIYDNFINFLKSKNIKFTRPDFISFYEELNYLVKHYINLKRKHLNKFLKEKFKISKRVSLKEFYQKFQF